MKQKNIQNSGLLVRASVMLVILSFLNIETFAQSALPNLGDLKIRLTEYRRSGAYDRDIAAVLAKAERFVEKRVAQVNKAAIVLDVDETALSNWPEMMANDFGYIPGGPCEALPAGPCGVRNWELSGRNEAIAPTLALFKAVRSKGVAVFFISGRPENERAATEENLQKAGYDGWAALLLRPEGSVPSTSALKSAGRAQIAMQGFTIIANIGDQPSDLVGGYAERTFLVPNPFYRIP
jgi:predicted secreted acid phosphatase